MSNFPDVATVDEGPDPATAPKRAVGKTPSAGAPMTDTNPSERPRSEAPARDTARSDAAASKTTSEASARKTTARKARPRKTPPRKAHAPNAHTPNAHAPKAHAGKAPAPAGKGPAAKTRAGKAPAGKAPSAAKDPAADAPAPVAKAPAAANAPAAAKAPAPGPAPDETPAAEALAPKARPPRPRAPQGRPRTARGPRARARKASARARKALAPVPNAPAPETPVREAPAEAEHADQETAVEAPRVYTGKHFAPKRHHRRLRQVLQVVAVLASVGLLTTTVSVVGAMRTPGNSSFTAKWADWLRAHHAGYLANDLERWYYTAKQPAKGGRLTHLNAIPLPPTTKPTVPSPTTTTTLVPPGPQPPSPVQLVVAPPLPGEGEWQATGPMINGRSGMYVAQFRADTVYTGQITTAVWINPTLLRIRLIPGAQEPGGTWPQPPYLSDAAEAAAVAAFNGGFRFQDAKGGIYIDGQAPVALRDGAESVVIDNDGTVNIGTWNQEVSMTPAVESVLQNLVPLIDNGALAPAAANDDQTVWGYTLGASTIVARSGIGVTADGALVYVAGPALSVRTLAEALQRSGAVRAMALDINPEWVTFNFFQHTDASDPTQVTATKLYPEMQRPATRYLGPTREDRDFFSVSTQ